MLCKDQWCLIVIILYVTCNRMCQSSSAYLAVLHADKTPFAMKWPVHLQKPYCIVRRAFIASFENLSRKAGLLSMSFGSLHASLIRESVSECVWSKLEDFLLLLPDRFPAMSRNGCCTSVASIAVRFRLKWRRPATSDWQRLAMSR